MAPEQARGEKAIDHRADLYSLGAILYLCLTGQIPFHDDDVLALLEKIRSEAPIPPSKLRPGIPADLESAVLRALAKPRDHRFPDAGSMFDAIFPFVDVGAVSLVPPPVRLLPAASIPHLPAPAETTAPTLPLDLASEEQDQPTTPLHPGPRPVAEAPTQLIQPQADEPTLKPLVREPSPVRRSWRGAVLVGVSLTVVVFAALAWLIWPEPSSPPLPSAAATSAADEQPPPEEVQAESAPATPDASGAPEETTNSPDPASDGGSVPDWSEDAAQPGPLPPVRRENQRPEPAKRMRQKAVPRGYGSLIAVEPQEPEPPPPAPRSQGYGRLIHEGEESGAE
jgi:serine/threonine protein kinase